MPNLQATQQTLIGHTLPTNVLQNCDETSTFPPSVALYSITSTWQYQASAVVCLLLRTPRTILRMINSSSRRPQSTLFHVLVPSRSWPHDCEDTNKFIIFFVWNSKANQCNMLLLGRTHSWGLWSAGAASLVMMMMIKTAKRHTHVVLWSRMNGAHSYINDLSTL